MKNRSRRSLCALPLIVCVILTILAGCGQTFYFANRALPPSGIANRALVAVENPSTAGAGILSILDAFYDIRYSYNRKTPSFSISGFAGTDPDTIQNMPAEQFGAVYSAGSGSLSLINYATEVSTATVAGLPGYSASIFISTDERYVFAANPIAKTVTVVDRTLGTNYQLNLPNAYRISINPGASVALVFVQNSDLVYSVLRLQNNQQVPGNAEDCEPQNQPVYCLVPVPGPAGQFNRPIKAVFSPDGSTAYVLNCAIECGGTQPSANYLPGTQASRQLPADSGDLDSERRARPRRQQYLGDRHGAGSRRSHGCDPQRKYPLCRGTTAAKRRIVCRGTLGARYTQPKGHRLLFD